MWLEEKTEDIKFETGLKALNSKLYEVHMVEDKATGEPDVDLPSYDKDLALMDVGLNALTLVIRSRKRKQVGHQGSITMDSSSRQL